LHAGYFFLSASIEIVSAQNSKIPELALTTIISYALTYISNPKL
jgi:hypothetical protein